MTQPSSAPADLARLRINRDAPPPGVRSALIRNLILLLTAAALIAVAVWYMRVRSVPTVQIATVGAPVSAGSGGLAGATSVSAKAAGRLAYLGVSEGSYVFSPS